MTSSSQYVGAGLTAEQQDVLDALTWDGTGLAGLWSDNSVPNPLSKFVSLTQAQYDALTPDADTIYFIRD